MCRRFYESKKFLVCLMHRDEKKTEDGKDTFFKALANRFWLTSKICLWFNKTAHGKSSIKRTS